MSDLGRSGEKYKRCHGTAEEYLHEEVHAFIEFLPSGLGEFQFGYVLHGMFFIHLGDDSDFVAERVATPRKAHRSSTPYSPTQPEGQQGARVWRWQAGGGQPQ